MQSEYSIRLFNQQNRLKNSQNSMLKSNKKAPSGWDLKTSHLNITPALSGSDQLAHLLGHTNVFLFSYILRQIS